MGGILFLVWDAITNNFIIAYRVTPPEAAIGGVALDENKECNIWNIHNLVMEIK